MWLFASAGYGAAIVNDAEAAGQTVDEFLGSDPLTDNTSDAYSAIQSLVNALDVLPADFTTQLTDNQTDLEGYGVVFP